VRGRQGGALVAVLRHLGTSVHASVRSARVGVAGTKGIRFDLGRLAEIKVCRTGMPDLKE
jgi:hypothetical protein